MKSATTTMKTHLQGDCTTLSRLYKITRKDALVFAFTDHDQNLDTTGNPGGGWSDGGHVYEAAVGFAPTAIEGKSDLSVDNQEVTAFIDSVTITENDLRFGVWDGADVEIRVCNWADLTQGELKMRKGQLGNVVMKNGLLTVELLGLTNKLQILLGRTYGAPCDAELGDSRCQATVPVESNSVASSPDAHHLKPNAGLTGAPGSYTGVALGYLSLPNANAITVNSGGFASGYIASTSTYLTLTAVTKSGAMGLYFFVLASGPAPTAGSSVAVTGFAGTLASNNGTFTITYVTPTGSGAIWSAGYYDDGILTFTSGINSGLSYQIDKWDGVTLAVRNQLFVAPAMNDTFDISPGCAHNTHDCQIKFGNIANYQGFPQMPGQDSVLQYPDPTS